MKVSSVLRLCVVGELILVVLGLVLSSWLENRLPPPLRDWLAAEAEREATVIEQCLFPVLGLVLVLSLVASIGLLFLRRWAAWLYLISLGLGSMLFPFTGPTVEHPIPDALDDLSLVCAGLILGLAFFTDALVRSANKGEPTVETNSA
jgi:cell division protein FtsW (lipid II flippase)